jgi:hypothetical protein
VHHDFYKQVSKQIPPLPTAIRIPQGMLSEAEEEAAHAAQLRDKLTSAIDDLEAALKVGADQRRRWLASPLLGKARAYRPMLRRRCQCLNCTG